MKQVGDEMSKVLYPDNTLVKFNVGYPDDVPDLGHPMKLINDSQEVECRECGEVLMAQGVRDTAESVSDSFSGYYSQSVECFEVFESVWVCPKCNTTNETEMEV